MANGNRNTVEKAQERRISPAERNRKFANHTRQHWQMLPGETAAAGDSIQFRLPKTRLLKKIRLYVTAKLTATNADGKDIAPKPFAPYTLFRRVAVDVNNGFSPFILTGGDLYLYNMLRGNADILDRAAEGRNRTIMGVTSSVGGTDNEVRFVADLPIALNERDPIGLILLQNEETNVTVSLDIDKANALAYEDNNGDTYTLELKDVKITPEIETFSIPKVENAFPDISILKLVQSTTENIPGAGVKEIKLPVGQTYRRIITYITDENGAGIKDDNLAGNLELIFNQADIPYSIHPRVLSAINQEQFDRVLPDGVFVFDFSYQGMPGYGGFRDYIDTEALTEFWLRVAAAEKGNVRCIYETLSKLK